MPPRNATTTDTPLSPGEQIVKYSNDLKSLNVTVFFGNCTIDKKTLEKKNLDIMSGTENARNWLGDVEMSMGLLKVKEEYMVKVVSTFMKADAYTWKRRMLDDNPDFLESTWVEFKKAFNEQYCSYGDGQAYAEGKLSKLTYNSGEDFHKFNEKFDKYASGTDFTKKQLVNMYLNKLPYKLSDSLGGQKFTDYNKIKPAVAIILERTKPRVEELGVDLNYYRQDSHRDHQFDERPPKRRWNPKKFKGSNKAGKGPHPKRRKSFKKSSAVTTPHSFNALAVKAHDLTNSTQSYSDTFSSDVDENDDSPYSFDVNSFRELLHPPIVLPRLATVVVNRNTFQVLLDTGSTADGVSVTTFHNMQLGRDFQRFSKPREGKALHKKINVLGFVVVQLKVHLLSGVITCTSKLFIFDSPYHIFILGLPFIQAHKDNLVLDDFLQSSTDKATIISNDDSQGSHTTRVNVRMKQFDYEEKYLKTLLTDPENEYCLCFITGTTDDRGHCSDMMGDDVRSTNTSYINQRFVAEENSSNSTQSTYIEANELSIDIQSDNMLSKKFRKKILNEFKDVVTNEPPTSLPPLRKHEHRIQLINPKNVISRKQYPLSQAERLELTKQIDELVKQGFVRTSNSPYNSPVLFVKKKDGSMRMCIDYRLLNNNTVKDKFPIPNIERLTSNLGNATVYSKLDLMSGYYQVRVEGSDIYKTAFSTDYGHYEWVVMPFGLTNAPSTFQRLMNETLREFLGKFVQVYLDDIFIYSPNEHAHYEHVKLVLKALRANHLIAKEKKCAFFFRELRFLGLVISADGIKTDPEKIEKVVNWPTPTTVKQAQSFIGLATYYRRFVKGFSKIAVPIHNFITNKGKWEKPQDEAFNKLKEVLTRSPTLVHPTWDSRFPFLVHTDACGTALGYTLEQLTPEGKRRGVIAYGSKKLKGSELNYSIYDREFMAVIEALKTWKYYLMGRHFIIRTDHKSLVYLKHQNLIDSTRVARWLDFLAQYDFEIQYVKGKDNSAADALSRYPEISAIEVNHVILDRMIEEDIEFNSLDNAEALQTLSEMVPNLEFKEKLMDAYKKDSFYSQIYHILESKAKRIPNTIRQYIKHYRFDNGLLYYSTLLSKPTYRIVIPIDNWLMSRLIFNAHNNLDAGHFGPWKTYLNLCDMFYWKGMFTMVKRYCTECVDCQKNNTSTQRLQGLFSPLPVPEGRWTDVTMDFVTGLPQTQHGNDMIMVICDRMTKMAHFIAVKKSLTAEQCARLFISNCFRHHGVPRRLVSDKDIRFMNRFWYTIHFLLGTSLLFSTTNHPQTDGQTERTNKILNQCLRKYCANDMNNWDSYLPTLEFAYNSTYQDSIKCSPFKLALGYEPESFKKVNYPIDVERYSPNAEEYFQNMQAILIQAQDNIVEAQRIQEVHHNKRRRFHRYKIGDMILLNKDANGINPQYYKIQPVFYGPYRLVRQENDNAFEVDLPIMNKRDRIINVEWFKPFTMPTYINRRVPQTDAEVKARIHEIVTIAGYDKVNKTYDVYWKDSAPTHASTITESQFNKAPLSLRKSLLYNARLIKNHDDLAA